MKPLHLCLLFVVLSATSVAFVRDVSAQAGPAPQPQVSPAEGFDTDIQYRVRSLRIEPLELNGTKVRQMSWTEQRLRLNTHYVQAGVGSLNVQLDALDGVLFGDNGRFLGDPTSNFGVSLNTRRPNLTRWQIGLPEGADPLDRKDYEPVLVATDPIKINWAYADIVLPVGLLRIGRQPMAYGSGLAVNDGMDHNRWGVSQFPDTVDRILFATKLDEAFYVATRGKEHVPDTSQDNGIIWGLFYDFHKQDLPQNLNDDLRQMGTQVEYRRKKADWFGLDWRDIQAGGTLVHLRNELFKSRVWSIPLVLKGGVENFDLSVQYVWIRGETREISEGFAGLTGDEARLQEIQAQGLRAIGDYHIGPVTLTMEFNYATGDADPRQSTPITSYNYARDTNVGLLMFEHIMAFESARSVAVGIENLSGNDVLSFPLTEVQSDGRYNNAISLFPQVYVDWVDKTNHRLWSRFGVLMAWPEADGVVDPILTTLNEDGNRIDDDAVNFHGGKPGTYYGTEIDVQLGWKFKEHFQWVIEGGYLFPGSSMQDQNGDAVNSYMLENRFVFNF